MKHNFLLTLEAELPLSNAAVVHHELVAFVRTHLQRVLHDFDLGHGSASACVVAFTPTPCAPREGEPFFVLLGRDPVAGSVVDSWATRRLNTAPGWRPDDQEMAKITEARAVALRMYNYNRQNRHVIPARADDADTAGGFQS